MNGEIIAICAVIMDEARKMEATLARFEPLMLASGGEAWELHRLSERHRDRCENLYQRVCEAVAVRTFGQRAPFCGWCGEWSDRGSDELFGNRRCS